MNVPTAKLPEGERWVTRAVLIFVFAPALALLFFIMAGMEKIQFLDLLGLLFVLLWFFNLKMSATVPINEPKNLIDGD